MLLRAALIARIGPCGKGVIRMPIVFVKSPWALLRSSMLSVSGATRCRPWAAVSHSSLPSRGMGEGTTEKATVLLAGTAIALMQECTPGSLTAETWSSACCSWLRPA